MRPATGFPEGVHREFAPIRPGHFWFENRRAVIVRAVAALPRTDGGAAIEVGCGDGFVLSRLPGRRWVGIDRTLGDARAVHRTFGIAAAVGSGLALPVAGGIDLVAALDVLEHLEDDAGALRAWRSVLGREGRLVLTVPAGPELWSRRDEFAGHVRRYTRENLRAVVEAAGLEVEALRPLFRVLWPAAWLASRLGSRTPVTDAASEYSVSRPVNAVLGFLAGLEERLMGDSGHGRGTSWLLVARRATARAGFPAS